eukprot:TRINITY_DN3460_c1_g3_i1.p1 TRINITY_DN3460_c1_g3~~TRINITY_DN3460_c1_g3_i1.p1  ORF type:complete len:616 (+),score=184.87 TRINITY_DN3460_c1_g3_i1:74-1849(+)
MAGAAGAAAMPHAVELEGLCEVLHVDAAAMARALQQPRGGTLVDVDAHALEAVMAQEAPAPAPARRRGAPAAQWLAFSEQMRPRAAPLITLTPEFKSMTPPPGMRAGVLAGRYAAPAAGVLRATVLSRTTDEVKALRKRILSGEIDAYGERRPLLGARRRVFQIPRSPVGVRDHPEPLSALLLPIDAESSILVVEPTPAASARPHHLLPDPIKTIAVKVTEDDAHHVKVSFLIEFARPFMGWAILIVGVVSMAAIGPVIKLMTRHGVSGFLVGCWNAQGLFMMFSTAALLEGVSPRDVAYLKTRFGFLLLAAAGTISGLGSGCWTLSFSWTSVPQSYLFNSFHPTLIIAWRLTRGYSVIPAEKVGVVCGLLGASLSLMDGGGGPAVPFGDLLAFMSSISLCFYLLASKKARSHLSLMVNLSCVTFFSALSQSLVACFLNPGGLTFDAHPLTGVFGWWQPVHFYLWLGITLVTGIGQAGYIGALKYLNPVIVSICMTTEPATATLFAMLLLREGLPSGFTIAGGLIIIAASVMVSYYSKHSKENVELEVELEDVAEVMGQRKGRAHHDGDVETPKLGAVSPPAAPGPPQDPA